MIGWECESSSWRGLPASCPTISPAPSLRCWSARSGSRRCRARAGSRSSVLRARKIRCLGSGCLTASTRAGSSSATTAGPRSKVRRRSTASSPNSSRRAGPRQPPNTITTCRMEDTIMESITTQGVAIPRLGFGTFRMPGGDAQPVVESAIALGYRHIDTAAMYENEAAVGAAITASGVNRNELFVTTKVWHDQLAPDALRRAFDASLGKLRLDHVDLYMIHWPSRDMDMATTLAALISLRERRLNRAIGVCNFNLPMIRRAVEEIGAPIASVQVEYHPFLSQDPMLSYLPGHRLPFTAHAPLASPR